jgi:hypothetical protein
MRRSFSWMRRASLLAALCVLTVSQARADLIVTLVGVTFADGGTASGTFTLNVDGYMESADIVTTPGTSIDDVALPGYTYLSAGAQTDNGASVFDTIFFFNSTADAFSLALDAEQALVPGFSGADPLVLGTDNLSTLIGSTETCQENASACGGPSYLDGRVVTAGELYVPEPATLGLLAAGAMAMPMLRRRRLKAERGAA